MEDQFGVCVSVRIDSVIALETVQSSGYIRLISRNLLPYGDLIALHDLLQESGATWAEKLDGLLRS